jgi:hypothetical protein
MRKQFHTNNVRYVPGRQWHCRIIHVVFNRPVTLVIQVSIIYSVLLRREAQKATL